MAETPYQDSLGLYLSGLARHARAYRDDATGKIFLTLPERLPFINREDTRIHKCKGAERVLDLALLYYRNIYSDPVDYWPVIAQFQPEPIIDPFIPLAAGLIVLIPSPSYIQEIVNGDTLVDFPQLW